MVEQSWWNSRGGTIIVEQKRLKSHSGTVVEKQSWWKNDGETVMVER